MPGYTLYTIGRGDLTPDELVKRLRTYNITTLVDARRDPADKSILETYLPEQGISYRYAGAYIGEGVELGSADYVMGIARLLNLAALENGSYVAVMSVEANPYPSHRHHVIARSLLDPTCSVIDGVLDLTIIHIDADGNLLPAVQAADFL